MKGRDEINVTFPIVFIVANKVIIMTCGHYNDHFWKKVINWSLFQSQNPSGHYLVIILSEICKNLKFSSLSRRNFHKATDYGILKLFGHLKKAKISNFPR